MMITAHNILYFIYLKRFLFDGIESFPLRSLQKAASDFCISYIFCARMLLSICAFKWSLMNLLNESPGFLCSIWWVFFSRTQLLFQFYGIFSNHKKCQNKMVIWKYSKEFDWFKCHTNTPIAQPLVMAIFVVVLKRLLQ